MLEAEQTEHGATFLWEEEDRPVTVAELFSLGDIAGNSDER
jgi:hypothetical protein